ncbi:hypothetical protein CC78DRAFT_267555 [Lojkania enalia]|uniref:Uncharacterized protein n=1 Tax=Lojkania enalia TaxID=147567 RepID=A0A9P4K737_9PLEO|nr:hypothetical protein CC78DRAFT_267555 [Didymosphaeria enalia]
MLRPSYVMNLGLHSLLSLFFLLSLFLETFHGVRRYLITNVSPTMPGSGADNQPGLLVHIGSLYFAPLQSIVDEFSLHIMPIAHR